MFCRAQVAGWNLIITGKPLALKRNVQVVNLSTVTVTWHCLQSLGKVASTLVPNQPKRWEESMFLWFWACNELLFLKKHLKYHLRYPLNLVSSLWVPKWKHTHFFIYLLHLWWQSSVVEGRPEPNLELMETSVEQTFRWLWRDFTGLSVSIDKYLWPINSVFTMWKGQTTLCKNPWQVYRLLIIFSASGFPVIIKFRPATCALLPAKYSCRLQSPSPFTPTPRGNSTKMVHTQVRNVKLRHLHVTMSYVVISLTQIRS